jgi:LPXTG-motif cell wall-anchored protein
MHKTLLKEARISFLTAVASIKQVAPAKMAQSGGGTTIAKVLTLPQTATPSQLYLLIGLLAVFSAVLLAGMRLWWARR